MRTINVHSLYTLTEIASKELVENVDLREREPYRRANVGPEERKLMRFHCCSDVPKSPKGRKDSATLSDDGVPKEICPGWFAASI